MSDLDDLIAAIDKAVGMRPRSPLVGNFATTHAWLETLKLRYPIKSVMLASYAMGDARRIIDV